MEKARWRVTKRCPACGAAQPIYPTPIKGPDGTVKPGYYTCAAKDAVNTRPTLALRADSPPSDEQTAYERRQLVRIPQHNVANQSAKPFVFTVRTGTILAHSHIGLAKWACALALRRLSRNDISATELGLLIGVSRKSAGIMIRCMNDLYRSSQGRDRTQAFLRSCANAWASRIFFTNPPSRFSRVELIFFRTSFIRAIQKSRDA
mgnify:CR=1 FL=1